MNVDLQWAATGSENALGSASYASAILNILEDATVDRMWSEEAVRATVNILADLDDEREVAGDLQKAILNVLEDSAAERTLLHDTQKAVLNILEDFEEEKANVERANEELDRAGNELQRANGELESFSYSVAHDLRAPLRAIDGFSRIIVEDHTAQLGEEGQRLLGIVITNVGRMGRLIDDLLAFSRLSRAVHTPMAVNMTQLVQSIFADLVEADPDRQVELSIGDLGVLDCDEPTMRQVWVNLASNAWKFTRNHVAARIEVTREDSEDDAVFSIRDNGAGFDMAYAEKLFGVFQRLHSASAFEGTGIGLAIVQRVIERHHGRIWASAAVDEGATFSFAIPLAGATA